MARSKKSGQKKRLPKHRMMQRMTDDAYKQFRETGNRRFKEKADRMQTKLDRSRVTYELKCERDERSKVRHAKRDAAWTVINKMNSESVSDKEITSDSSDYEVFGNICTDSEDEDKGPGDGDAGADGGTGLTVQ